MNFKVTIHIDDVVLIDSFFFIKSSWWIFRLHNEIKKQLPCKLFVIICFVTIIDSIIMIIPDSNHLSSFLLHLIIIWKVNWIILTNYIFIWCRKIIGEECTNVICVCCITSPDEDIWVIFAYCFKNVIWCFLKAKARSIWN